ncbi:MAG: hypothetical protein COW47_02445 [Candidatus Huberarchaeum crystalense]|uniref:PIN domain-containing protein n=1 Tax=Huberarchaeum crystalense TaxID=2014257 RepID=A0A2G9LJ11_HUBC1|nr:PIN domain-containing protein [archaeon]OIP20330.1 MAG: hypothetical protein AUJ91_01575 [archaeon CG2_30_31_98]PIN66442.1 MAG: hypothetical protein COW69_02325 [Candidatus Huberarchaeum crystalense]NCS98405.1 PIN domain-containing protein [archaeon]PIV13642.1 MAG: hypothetical protein COS45_01805 [Candidatus Huberarchaeum crystalense]
MLIIIDTNAWIAGVRQKVDIFRELNRLFGEYELLVSSFICEELIKVAKKTKKGKDKQAAKIALDLIKIRKLKITETNSNQDIDSNIIDLIKNLRRQNKEIVLVTNDKDLQARAKYIGAKIIAWKRGKILDTI